MSFSQNQVNLTGKVVSSIEYSKINNGQTMATFMLVVPSIDRQLGTETTEHFRICVFNQAAEYAKNNVYKGSAVKIDGTLHNVLYITETGIEKDVQIETETSLGITLVYMA